MWRQGKSTIGVSVGTNFRYGTALSQKKVLFTSAHFAMDLWTATWRQGESTIDLCATINFTSRTVKSASRHGVMRTVARSALLLFGHRCHVAALLSSMTCHRENHVTTSSGTFPRKRQRKQKRNKSLLKRTLPGPQGLVGAAGKVCRGLSGAWELQGRVWRVLRAGKRQPWTSLKGHWQGLRDLLELQERSAAA